MENVTRVINEKADSIKITKGQRGAVGYELKMHFDLSISIDESIETVKEAKDKLEKQLGITDEEV